MMNDSIRAVPIDSNAPVNLNAGAAHIEAPTDRVRQLQARLEDGYARIEDALARGENVDRWEAFWIELLHQYEACCDGYVQAA